MKPGGYLKLVGEVRDLQILDVRGRRCGIVDDIELTRRSNGRLVVTAILVGPGAYLKRLPWWLSRLVAPLLMGHEIRVSWASVKRITSVVELKQTAASYGLARSEASLEQLLSRIPGAKS